MSFVKLKHPNGKHVQPFEFTHAQAILKMQVDGKYPKKSCWTMVEENPKDDDNNEGSDSKSSKGGKEPGTKSSSKTRRSS